MDFLPSSSHFEGIAVASTDPITLTRSHELETACDSARGNAFSVAKNFCYWPFAEKGKRPRSLEDEWVVRKKEKHRRLYLQPMRPITMDSASPAWQDRAAIHNLSAPNRQAVWTFFNNADAAQKYHRGYHRGDVRPHSLRIHQAKWIGGYSSG